MINCGLKSFIIDIYNPRLKSGVNDKLQNRALAQNITPRAMKVIIQILLQNAGGVPSKPRG
jgi:hypothetical protein